MCPSYTVTLSGRARDELIAMGKRARAIGKFEQFRSDLTVMLQRLTMHPQFGEQRRDASIPLLQEWAGAVNTLVARYLVDDLGCQVIVAVPMVTMSSAGY